MQTKAVLARISMATAGAAVLAAGAMVLQPQQFLVAHAQDDIIHRDVPYVPTPQEVVDVMLKLAEVDGDDTVYDLGSGDGRIVITAAKEHGARGVGVDIDPERIEEAWDNARKAGVADKVKFIQGDLFKVDLSDASAVTLYLLPSVNMQLRPKLFAELKPGTPVVSHSFDMGDWQPDQEVSVNGRTVYKWRIPADVSGRWNLRRDGERGPKSVIVQLDQRLQKLSGRVSIDSVTTPIQRGRVDGKRVSFVTSSHRRGQAVTYVFSGVWEQGRLEGTLSDGTEQSLWRAQRPEGTLTLAR